VKVVERAVTIGPLFEPVALWNEVRVRVARAGATALIAALAVTGGLVVATATEIGVRHFNGDWSAALGYSVQPARGWSAFALLWATATALPIVQGLVAALLLPLYGRPRAWRHGLAVGVVGSMPIYAASVALVLLPGVLLVGIAFLISCAWWGSGARLLLGVPLGEAADHVAATLVVSAILVSLALAAASALAA
jgi:hypothetical protein